MNRLSTIGYQSDTVDGVIRRLKAADVDLVVDVRAVAASRRAGFSKTILSGSLNAAGVDYLHLRALGTPKAGRDAAKAGRAAEMAEIFAVHMEEPASQLALAEAVALTQKRRIALLCYEDDPACCHRTILAREIRDRLKCEVVNL